MSQSDGNKWSFTVVKKYEGWDGASYYCFGVFDALLTLQNGR
jgi:hypothetical protein